MPVEILELVIKAKVSDQPNGAQGAAPVANALNAQNDEQLGALEKAVQEALEILKRKNER